MPALSMKQRKHPAQAALNGLPDGWAELTEYWVDTVDIGAYAGYRLLALMRWKFDHGDGWTIGRILRYLRDYQPEVTVEVKPSERSHNKNQPLFLIGGMWTTRAFPELKLIKSCYELLEAERAWAEASKGAVDQALHRAREAAKELDPGQTTHANADFDQWLQEWGQDHGYDTGMRDET